jgi:hypothetical protein
VDPETPQIKTEKSDIVEGHGVDYSDRTDGVCVAGVKFEGVQGCTFDIFELAHDLHHDVQNRVDIKA